MSHVVTFTGGVVVCINNVVSAGVPASEEGPNQNDIVLLADNRTLMCVMRVDSGEGPTMRFSPLVRSFSTDKGVCHTCHSRTTPQTVAIVLDSMHLLRRVMYDA